MVFVGKTSEIAGFLENRYEIRIKFPNLPQKS